MAIDPFGRCHICGGDEKRLVRYAACMCPVLCVCLDCALSRDERREPTVKCCPTCRKSCRSAGWSMVSRLPRELDVMIVAVGHGKDGTNTTIPVRASLAWPVGVFKMAIEKRAGIPHPRLRLLFDGQRLEDECDLADYGVREGKSEVDFLECQRGD